MTAHPCLPKVNGGCERPFPPPVDGDPVDDYQVDHEHLPDDVVLAQKAVAIHQPEQWPSGRYCRNCHGRWPCRLYRWGHAVLWTAGWREGQIADLVRRAASGEVPW